MAQPVSSAPPAKALTSSANSPSAVQARSERRQRRAWPAMRAPTQRRRRAGQRRCRRPGAGGARAGRRDHRRQGRHRGEKPPARPPAPGLRRYPHAPDGQTLSKTSLLSTPFRPTLRPRTPPGNSVPVPVPVRVPVPVPGAIGEQQVPEDPLGLRPSLSRSVSSKCSQRVPSPRLGDGDAYGDADADGALTPPTGARARGGCAAASATARPATARGPACGPA